MGNKGPRILRLCIDPATDYSPAYGGGLPIGFPVLPEAGSPAHFILLREWLEWCDTNHNCSRRDTRSQGALPTRLIYVGHSDPDVLRLCLSKECGAMKYTALSHCWGRSPPTQTDPQFCTTNGNIHARLKGFSISELPKTFQDAVRVTQELGIKHLWIDSVCIIQWNLEDWSSEADLMQAIFASAYCTIAATSAVDSNAGFLARNGNTEYMRVQVDSGNQFYVCANIDDFDKDVEEAQLNTRAWVMQERVLARRTIHFSNTQTYWECGHGVYCENLTRMESSFRKKYFLLDPDFPNRLLDSGEQRTLELINYLSEDYSKRSLSHKTDRCVAMSGLEARIADALLCESRYGVFRKYLHRNLMWQASNGKMGRIAYENNHQVPSWSWMAYSGGIQFLDIPARSVSWMNGLRFDEGRKSALIADVGKFRNCTIKPDGDCWTVFNLFGKKRGWIRYDVEDNGKHRKERCVVVGRTWRRNVEEYYILVVLPNIVEGEYRRVGIGMVRSSYAVRWKANVRVV